MRDLRPDDDDLEEEVMEGEGEAGRKPGVW